MEDAVLIVDVDRLMARTLELEGLLCFHCPLLEPTGPAGRGRDAFECPIRADDLEPVISGRRSGVKAMVVNGQIPAYTVFGPPSAFRNADGLPFGLDPDALLVAALFAIPQAREENYDVDLLVAVMDFAREHDYGKVQVLCRQQHAGEPEARAEILRAAGFDVAEPVDGLCLAETTVEAWDSTQGDVE